MTVTFGDGVFCLAGANGLGKSTFIAAINFALTGLVPEPERRFESVAEHYRHTLPYARRYFAGRVDEADRAVASVELEFSVGSDRYRLRRHLFSQRELASLTISGVAQTRLDRMTSTERHVFYAKRVARSAGFRSFDQLVFLVHFLLTFDERRSLLFWDARALERVLFLAFDVDPRVTQEVDKLQREIDKYDSDARNLKYRATDAKRRIREIEAVLGHQQDVPPERLEEWRGAQEASTTALELALTLESELDEVRLEIASLSASLAAIQQTYERAYAEHLRAGSVPELAPVVLRSTRSGRCEICLQQSPIVAKTLQRAFERRKCPLCGQSVTGGHTVDKAPLLALDQEMAATEARLQDRRLTERRMLGEVARAREEHETQVKRRLDLQREFPFLLAQDTEPAGVSALDSYRVQVVEASEASEEARRQREDRKQALATLQLALASRYADAESRFLPAFQRLAEAFLGLELSIRLVTSSGSAPLGLVLSVEGSARRQSHQLSESQRFFVDIALRMALSQFMSAEEARGAMLVDTPEGSLDVAYESRVGEMFALFVHAGYQLIMTANINTSNLLVRLAERCGHSAMRLERMTGWTGLSRVQREEERLFDGAFAAIEEALERGGRPHGPALG